MEELNETLEMKVVARTKEVIEKMEEIYGVKINIKDQEILNHEYTIAVPIENLEIAIEALENILNIKVDIKKDNEFFVE